MSYCRLSEADIYVYESAYDRPLFICHWCPERESEMWTCRSPLRMALHVVGHMLQGYSVPLRALVRLVGRAFREEWGS